VGVSSSSPSAGEGALSGVRVIDLTSVLMGPYATQLLGDMGADIIKIEPPGGDSVRGIGPMINPGMGYDFLQVNRNKRSLVLDLKKADGMAALLRLIDSADVLTYNVRPQAMGRLGLTWAHLAQRNPRLIYVGTFGYGQDGPYAAKPAYDDLIQGVMGVPSLVAQVGDGVPRYVPMAFVDRAVGIAACGIVTAALYRREKTGKGQSVEVPMFETMLPFVLGEHMAGATFAPAIGPMGYPRLLARERTPYPTADGFVCALIYNDKQWQSFFTMIGEPERFTSDPRLRSMTTRTEHIGDLYAMVARLLRNGTTAQWLQRFEQADIPAMPLHTLESLIEDPHLQAVGFFQMMEHPSEGTLRMMAPSGQWSESPPSIRRGAPRLGEHSAEVLAEAGYSLDEIRRLAAAGVTRVQP
jgi:crotonobetainyl-CoA:carnitine CoA-transferase CaiB-like acyl-CoA transferase